MHPDIRDIVEQRAKSSQADLVVIEIPLLRDRSDYPYVSQVWTVEASMDDRIARIAERDDIDQAQVEAIIANQPSETLRRRIADAVINNHGEVKELTERGDDAGAATLMPIRVIEDEFGAEQWCAVQ